MPEEREMRKQAPTIEWHMVDSDADWERLHAPSLERAPDTNRRLRLQHYLWSGVALLLVVGVGEWWWRTTQAVVPQLAADMTATTPLAPDTVASGGDAGVVSLPGGQAVWAGDQTASDGQHHLAPDESGLRMAIECNAPAAHGEIAHILVCGDRAVTRMVMYAEHGEPAYRQTRFYRQTESGWIRTDPEAALWGAERSLETPSFVFHFRQEDAPTVITVAPQIEGISTTLRRTVGLPVTLGAEKMVIEVSVTEPPGHVLPWVPRPERLRVPSPAVYRAPVGVTDAELLAQSIALPLLAQVLAQANEQYAVKADRQLMLKGLYLWQVWDLDLPLSAWREDVAMWLYAAEPAIQPGQLVVLPDHYEELCAAHTLWMPAPVQLGIPLLCTELDGKPWYFASWGSRDPLLRLDQFAVPAPRSLVEGSVPVSHPGQAIALATLIEYAVATYGRERLPALVAGLGHYERWETLIPVVYGVSAAEFEAGWRAYLSAHYGVPDRY
jgi:hypothetical protein